MSLKHFQTKYSPDFSQQMWGVKRKTWVKYRYLKKYRCLGGGGEGAATISVASTWKSVLGGTLQSAGECVAMDKPRPLLWQQLIQVFLSFGHAVLQRSVRGWCGSRAGMCWLVLSRSSRLSVPDQTLIRLISNKVAIVISANSCLPHTVTRGIRTRNNNLVFLR